MIATVACNYVLSRMQGDLCRLRSDEKARQTFVWTMSGNWAALRRDLEGGFGDPAIVSRNEAGMRNSREAQKIVDALLQKDAQLSKASGDLDTVMDQLDSAIADWRPDPPLWMPPSPPKVKAARILSKAPEARDPANRQAVIRKLQDWARDGTLDPEDAQAVIKNIETQDTSVLSKWPDGYVCAETFLS